MRVHEIEAIAPGNPFLGDCFHMGTTIGVNVTVMYARFDGERHDYIIIVDTETGERLNISFPVK